MKCTIRGWGRNCGKRSIISWGQGIRIRRDSFGARVVRPDSVTVNTSIDEQRCTVSFKAALEARGDYICSVTLERDEVIHLAREVLGKCLLEELLTSGDSD